MHGGRRLVGDDVTGERAATLAPPCAIDAQVADERDEPRDDRAPLGGVLRSSVGHGDERVVDDVLGLGAVAQDAEGDREEDRRVAIVQRADGSRVPLADAPEELAVRRRRARVTRAAVCT